MSMRDRLWMWGHQEGSHNTHWNLPSPSRMTPAEGALYMGLPNALMVTYGGNPVPPFDREARALTSLKKVVWSIVGDSGSKRNDQKTDLEEVVALAGKYPNICGAIMDDFFQNGEDQTVPGRYTPQDLAGFRRELRRARQPLDLWVVLYDYQLNRPLQYHLAECDVVSFWTWKGADLAQLEQNLPRVQALAPGKRIMLGCYLWDYAVGKPMPLDLMQHQCRLGQQWIKEGKIEGMVFLASCICDIGLESVEWTREWIREVGA